MQREVTVGDLGNGVESAVFAAWLVTQGENISAGQAIAEVMTDKVNLEVESPYAGTIVELCCQPDDEVHPGLVIARITDAD